MTQHTQQYRAVPAGGDGCLVTPLLADLQVAAVPEFEDASLRVAQDAIFLAAAVVRCLHHQHRSLGWALIMQCCS